VTEAAVDWLVDVLSGTIVVSGMQHPMVVHDVGAHTELALLLKKTLDGVLTLHTSRVIAISSDQGCSNFIWVHGLCHGSVCRGPYGAHPTP